MLAANVSEIAEEVKAGQLRMLGVMSPERSPFLPGAPTFKLSLQPLVIKGEDYRAFLKKNEQETKKLMGW